MNSDRIDDDLNRALDKVTPTYSGLERQLDNAWLDIERLEHERERLIKACQLARSAIETATEMGTAESFGLAAAHKKLCEVLK